MAATYLADNCPPSKAKPQRYTRCAESQQILDGRDPNVVCLIRRRWSSNVVVYRARTVVDANDHITLHPKHPMDIFWLKCDRHHLEKHRKSGKADDRVELGRLERKFAYGASCKMIGGPTNPTDSKPEKSKRSRRWSFSRSKKSKSAKSVKSRRNNRNRKLTIESITETEKSTASFEGSQSETYRSDTFVSVRHPVIPVMDYELDDIQDIEGLETISEQEPSFQMIFNALKSDETMTCELRMDAVTRRPGLYAKITVSDQLVECRIKEIVPVLKAGRMGVLKVTSVTVIAHRCDNGQTVEHVLKGED